MLDLINDFLELDVIYLAVGLVVVTTLITVIMWINDYNWYKKMTDKNTVLKNKLQNTILKIDHYRQNADKNASLNRAIDMNIKKQVYS